MARLETSVAVETHKRRRKARAPDERREDLLSAARTVFAERGLPSATVAEITQAAGVAKGTFYLYFESREALVEAMRQQFVDELVARATGLYRQVGRDDWWALADVTVETMIDFMLEHRDLVQVFAQDGRTRRTRRAVVEADAKLRNVLAAGIKAGTEAGAFGVADPAMTATFLEHAIHGAVEEAVLNDEGVDRDRLVAAARDLTRRTLRRERP